MTEERSTEEDVVIRTWKMEMGGHRNKGRSKLRWSDVIRKCMKEKQRNKETDMITRALLRLVWPASLLTRTPLARRRWQRSIHQLDVTI